MDQNCLDAYIAAAASIAGDKRGPLLRTAEGRTGWLTLQTMAPPEVYRMIQRGVETAGVATRTGATPGAREASSPTWRTAAGWSTRGRWPGM